MTTTEEARRVRDQLDVRDRLALRPEDLDTLDALCIGLPVRSGKLALDALRTKLDFSLTKPAAQLDIRQAVIQVLDPYRGPTPSLPAADAVEAQVLPLDLPAEPRPPPAPKTRAGRLAAEFMREQGLRRMQAAERPAPPAPLPPLPLPPDESEDARVLRLAREYDGGVKGAGHA